MAEFSLLVGDIGGTNARFALAAADGTGYEHAKTFQCADYPDATSAIRAYLDGRSVSTLDAICIACAGPIVNNAVRFTNNPWVLDGAELEPEFGASQVRLLNDFEAVAHALPLLDPGDCLPLGKNGVRALTGRRFSVAAIGPGTGLGAVGLQRHNDDDIVVISEAGNSGFSAQSDVQAALQSELRKRDGYVPVERLVSGPGVEEIYRALASIAGTPVPRQRAADIFAQGLEGTDLVARQSVELFFEMLGQVAGDVALLLGAWDGVYVTGGVTSYYPDALAESQFRAGFESKGRYRELMQTIPTALITRAEPGLLGAANCANRLVRDDLS